MKSKQAKKPARSTSKRAGASSRPRAKVVAKKSAAAAFVATVRTEINKMFGDEFDRAQARIGLAWLMLVHDVAPKRRGAVYALVEQLREAHRRGAGSCLAEYIMTASSVPKLVQRLEAALTAAFGPPPRGARWYATAKPRPTR